jgi:hypothetical protein
LGVSFNETEAYQTKVLPHINHKLEKLARKMAVNRNKDKAASQLLF